MSNELNEQDTNKHETNSRKKVEKIIGLIAVFIAVALIAFYGANALIAYMDNPPRDSAQYSNGSQNAEWGNMSLTVPEGYNLVGGTSIDKEDPNACFIQKAGEAADTYIVTIVDEDEAASQLEQVRNIEVFGETVELEIDGVKWEGWDFFNGSRQPAFQAYGVKDGRGVYVKTYYHSMEEDTSIAVMGGAIPR